MKVRKFEAETLAGRFTLAPELELDGQLHLNGANSVLNLYAKEFFTTRTESHLDILGFLYERTKVSLLDCVTTSSGQHGGVGVEGRRYSSRVFPHLVLFGDEHIASTNSNVTSIHFVVDDATTIFSDYDAFGGVIDAAPHIEHLARINNPNATIDATSRPEIFYYTGKGTIFSVDTNLGVVSANHCPEIQLPSPSGFRLDNSISVDIEFDDPLTVSESTTRLIKVLRFLEIIVGRPQNLQQVMLRVDSETDHPVFLELYWSRPPNRDASHGSREPHPADILLNAVSHTDQFSAVLRAWLNRAESWRDARARFATSFDKQRSYDIDRLVGCANMFDILPDSAFPPPRPLDPLIAAARDSCKTILSKLPLSAEKNSILGALGRLGKNTLKRKIRCRAEPIVAAAGETFPKLDFVIDQAVNCRNYFVHGGKSKISYDAHFECVRFFVDTLEFVFAASDLMEAGWDVSAWLKGSATLSHPFVQYRFGYQENVRTLHSLLGPAGDA